MVGLATDRSKPMTNASICELKQITPQKSVLELIAQFLPSVMDHAAKQLKTEYLQVLLDQKHVIIFLIFSFFTWRSSTPQRPLS